MTVYKQQASSIEMANGDPAIVFDQNDETWEIWHMAPGSWFGTVISSTGGSAVVSVHDHSTLLNQADIESASILGAGVSFQGDHGVITNYAEGEIVGSNVGVSVAGDVETINNSGVIGSLAGSFGLIGSYGVKLEASSNHVTLDNAGWIGGHQAGVLAFSDHEGGHIANTGTIRSDGAGVQVQTIAGAQTFIDNDGAIVGSVASIRTSVGGIVLDNAGGLSGMVDLNGAANDTILNHGSITGRVFLGGGNDHFVGFQGISGEVFGEAGNDQLSGGNHADRLNGGLGRDILTGGNGADRFEFGAVADSTVGANHDVITDFRQGQHDLIDLSGIDGNGALAGDAQLVFMGTHAFTGGGQVRYVLEDHAGTLQDRTMIYACADAHHAPQLQIEVKGLVHFVAGDFLL